MDIKINYIGSDIYLRDKYSVESYGDYVTITKIADTTNYNRIGGQEIDRTEERSSIVIPKSDINRLILSLQKIIY